MPESRKTIPITAVPASHDADTEIGSCAELEPFALRVIGDSMTPEFLDGHVIILDPGLPPTHGAYIVAVLDGETLFRQYWVDGDHPSLRALNAAHPSIEFSSRCRVIGVVTQRAGKRRAERKRYD